jgi:hypothetical protein
MKLINVRGGCIPEFSNASTQTEMQVKVCLPYIFTEVAGQRLERGSVSMMNRLAALNKDAPRTAEIEQEALANSRKKFTPRSKFSTVTSLEDTANLFDNIFMLKLNADKIARRTYVDLDSIDEFTALQFVQQH